MRAQHHRGDGVDDRHVRDRHQQPARPATIAQECPTIRRATTVASATTGQHGHTGSCVVVLEAQGERPEVRGRPPEDDEEQQDRRPGQAAGHRRPSDEDRHAPGRPAPDDVGRRAALEPDRVDHHVVRRWRTAVRTVARGLTKTTMTAVLTTASTTPNTSASRRTDGRRCQRPAAGALHDQVDVAVEVAVEAVRRAGGQRAADERGHHQPQPRGLRRPPGTSSAPSSPGAAR